jgi:hypothetical protein
MDDTTMSEVLNVSDHISGESIGNYQRNLESVLQFTNDENMQLNFKKCKEMHIDFRKNKTVIPPTTLGEQSLTKVRSYKLLSIWFDDDLKWKTNHLLPKKTSQIKQRETRMNEATYYNFACKTERFKHSQIVYAIGKYNLYIDK